MEGRILTRNFVSKEVHAALHSHSMEVRKSTSIRRENISERIHLQQLQSQVAMLTAWMEDQRSKDQQLQDRFDQMQRSIELLIHNQAATTGGLSSSGGTLNTPVNHSVLISFATNVKEISLSFLRFDGQSPIMEWIFKAEKFFNYHHTPLLIRIM
ncbi:uncharacterized protein [Glycine max]|uniref:uncharacterized protein n=1 Tax=Glycine max TaxID=3847 RepID=UPI0003DE7732|nr:uncharacterized protein LOC121173013 [Glycine max]